MQRKKSEHNKISYLEVFKLFKLQKYFILSLFSLVVILLMSGSTFSGILHAQEWSPLQFESGDYFSYEASFENGDLLLGFPITVRVSYTISVAGLNNQEFLWETNASIPLFGKISISDSVIAQPEDLVEKLIKHYEELYDNTSDGMEIMALVFVPIPIIHALPFMGEIHSIENITTSKSTFKIGNKSLKGYSLSHEYIEKYKEYIGDLAEVDDLENIQVWLSPDLPVPLKMVYPAGEITLVINLVEYQR